MRALLRIHGKTNTCSTFLFQEATRAARARASNLSVARNRIKSNYAGHMRARMSESFPYFCSRNVYGIKALRTNKFSTGNLQTHLIAHAHADSCGNQHKLHMCRFTLDSEMRIFLSRALPSSAGSTLVSAFLPRAHTVSYVAGGRVGVGGAL